MKHEYIYADMIREYLKRSLLNTRVNDSHHTIIVHLKKNIDNILIVDITQLAIGCIKSIL
jgi:hypothetical protein